MPILPMALSLVMGYAIHAQFGRIWFSVLQSAIALLQSTRCVLVRRLHQSAKLLEDHELRHGFMAGWHWLKFWSRFAFTVYTLHEIWSVDSQENHYNCCHQMSDFKAKMHQIRFRQGLCPRHRWGRLQRFFRHPIAGFKGPTSKGGEGMEISGGEL